MRDTTKIKAIAGEALADLSAATQLGQVSESLTSNLKEIINIATRMDARTGTSDPSAKAGK